jgi:hypothetical protein
MWPITIMPEKKKMDYGKSLAVAIIVLSCAACIAYASQRDARHAIYWFASALLLSAVTF